MTQIQGVTNDRTDTATTSRRGHVQTPGLHHKVPTDQEIVGETQLVDHAQFAIQTRHHRFRQHAVLAHLRVFLVSISQPFFAQLTQAIFGRDLFGKFVNGEETLAQL